MTEVTIELPRRVQEVFAPPRGSVQYRWLYGGRGSGKSQGVAIMGALYGYSEPLRILCVREFQNSIAESFHAELKQAISERPWMEAAYDVGRDYLRGQNGTEFIFRGLRRNAPAIKSLARIDLTIIEEAEQLPEESWLNLEATVLRQPKAEVWPIWNPGKRGSPVDKRFREHPPKNGIGAKVNWIDNPFFPEGMESLRLRERERLDPEMYAHIWEGEYLDETASQVFRGKLAVREFEPGKDWQGPYQGIDFGFYPDPFCATRVWVHNDRLWFEYEAYGQNVELDATADFVAERIPDFASYVTRADSAEPKSISYLQRHGLPKVEGVKKWPGSVIEGVRWFRTHREIVLHPRCENMIRDFTLYSHKVDRLTGDVLPELVDANNHGPDAGRYALAPVIKQVRPGGTKPVKGLL